MPIDHTAPSDVTDAQIRNSARRIWTELNGRILSYDETTQKASVQVISKDRGVSLPPLHNLPVQWPSGVAESGEAWSLTGPLSQGNRCVVHVLTLPIDEWLEKADEDLEAARGERWRFSLSNSYVTPGLSPFSDPLPALAVDSVSPVLRGDPVLLGDSLAVSFVSLAMLTDARFAELKSWITDPGPTGLGAQVAAFIALATPIIGPPTWVPSIPNTRATKVKAT